MCGIFGIFNHKSAANLTYLGLHALQHRGQESAGIASSDGNVIHSHKAMGLVSDVFDSTVLKKLPGLSAIGHVRYSTAGSSDLRNAQPMVVEYAKGFLAVAHNGNLTNAPSVRKELESYGSIFQSTSDTEVIIHLIALAHEHLTVERLIAALRRVEGAYALVVLTEKELICARDPYGFRPLCLGKLGNATVVSSESCAFDLIEAEFVREIEPGEIVHITREGMKSISPFGKVKPSFCIFEFIYFARPDSVMLGRSLYSVRKAFGRQLAREAYVEADIVIPVPDSGIGAAVGYAMESRIPFELGLMRNHYVGRTFIEPEESIRHFGVKLKLSPVRDVVKGKRIVVVDDSIVRATTGRKIIAMLRQSGAEQIHFRVASPPTRYPCFYGIDTPTRKELIASSHTIEEIREFMGCDSLEYLSLEGMKEAIGDGQYGFCDACFSGDYPSAPLLTTDADYFMRRHA